MTVLLHSDYQWKTRPKSRIIPGDPVTSYAILVRDSYRSGYQHWRKMLAILTKAEEFSL